MMSLAPRYYPLLDLWVGKPLKRVDTSEAKTEVSVHDEMLDALNARPADNIEVRMEIVARIHRGEITLKAGQAELRRIVRKAKDAGEPTYFDAIRGTWFAA